MVGYFRLRPRGAGSARPSPAIGVFEHCCSNPCKTVANAAGAARRTQRHDRDIPDGSNRSGAPHSRSARAIAVMSDDRECRGTEPAERTDCHSRRQYDRKPARCQRITVSGRMMASAPQVFGNHPQTQRRTNLSPAENGNRPTLPRRSTMICCRSTRTSASSAVRDRNRSRTRLKISLMRSAIRPSVARFCAPRQPDSIYDSDRTLETGLAGWACRIRTSESVREPPYWICVTISPAAGASPAAETRRV